MKKLGFTLAEVLITLLIIGVVATLTAPALINNVGDAKVGPQLAKFVNSFENAIQNFFLDESVSSLKDYDLAGEDFIYALSKHLIMSELDDTSYGIRNSLGQNTGLSESGAEWLWQTKDGYILDFGDVAAMDSGLASAQYNSNKTDHGAYTGTWGIVTVDIGGLKGQHRAGKEVFAFLIDYNGTLVPMGSKTHKWLMDGKTWKTCSLTSSDTYANLACTGEIADNGYKKSSK